MTIQPLLENLHQFRPENFGAAGELVHRASHHEPPPPALIVTCADAGLLAECLTCTDPDGSQSHSADLTDNTQRQRAAEQEAVLVSLEHLPTYPCVRERLDRGTLHLHGWFFNTASGGQFAFNPVTVPFGLLMTFAEGRRG